MNVQIRNSIGVLTDDSFTQTNPPVIATAGTISTRVNQTKTGVLSGSVAFARYLDGENYVGGAGSNAVQVAAAASLIGKRAWRALGCFINSANGNLYENTPGVASGVGPYVSGMGTCGNALYETYIIVGVADPAAGKAITYYNGAQLVASRNGYLMSRWNYNDAVAALIDCDVAAVTAESYVYAAATQATIIGILKMAPDAVQTELVYDQRI
jgi:hypothetical protein